MIQRKAPWLQATFLLNKLVVNQDYNTSKHDKQLFFCWLCKFISFADSEVVSRDVNRLIQASKQERHLTARGMQILKSRSNRNRIWTIPRSLPSSS